MNIECIWLGPTALGGGALWHVDEQVLYFVDIVGQLLHRLNPANGEHQSWRMPGPIGCVAATASGGLIAGIGDAIYAVDLPSGHLTHKIDIDSGLRLNDGKCDRQGRFWLGTCDPYNPMACLYRYESSGRLTPMQDNIYISNGLGWSPDNKYFYYTDSITRKIYCYDFDVNTGDIHHQRVLIQTPEGEGVPDGLTVDNEGYIWSARWEGSKIVRYAPDGTVDREIKMPVLRPTSCIFGGPNLDILYVTSCSHDVNETQVLPLPNGGVFAIDVGVKGFPEPKFAG